jgi:hypothetical protein
MPTFVTAELIGSVPREGSWSTSTRSSCDPATRNDETVLLPALTAKTSRPSSVRATALTESRTGKPNGGAASEPTPPVATSGPSSMVPSAFR